MSALFILLFLVIVAALLTALIYPFVAAAKRDEIIRHVKTVEARMRSLEKSIEELKRKPRQSAETAQAPVSDPTDQRTPLKKAVVDLTPDIKAGTSTAPREKRPKSQGDSKPVPEPEPTADESSAPPELPSLATSPPVPPTSLQSLVSKTPTSSSPPPTREDEAAKSPPEPRPKPKPQPEAEPKAEPVEAPGTKAIPWRRIFEAAQLLPPSSSEDSAEVRLAKWWTTRVGTILLVIGSVFLGVYVSQDSPALRLTCLGLVSALVIGAGLWLERRFEAFGRIVTAGGLGMAFVTAFAASAFETTRVIDSAAVGTLIQALAVTGMVLWSLWKNDTAVATMALICGYIACAFSQSHDLGNHVVAGLLLLGAAGSGLLVLRRWRVPAMVALGGSWAGFIGLILFDWRIFETTPSPSAWAALACLVAMTVIFEIAGITFRLRHPELASSRRLRWGTLANTSLAVVAAYLAGRLVYPDHLSWFYLAFAALTLSFAAWHLRPGAERDPGLAQTLFLKSMALLALFFVARFDGPVRWLSLSLQTATLLYAWHRHRSGWLLLACALAFAGTLSWMWIDLLRLDWPDWSPLSVRSLVGGISLLILTAVLATQARLRQLAGDESGSPSLFDDASLVRLAGALFVVSVALGLASVGNTVSETGAISRLIFLTSFGVLAILPTIGLRSLPPILVGGLTLIATAIEYLMLDRATAHSLSGVMLGQCLVLLAYAAAEAVYRCWPRNWSGGEIPRGLAYGFGLLLLTVTMMRMAKLYEWGEVACIAALIGLALAVAATLLLHLRRLRFDQDNPAPGEATTIARWLVSLVGGFGIVFLARSLLAVTEFNAFWLAFASLAPMATIFRTRDAAPVAAGGIPLGLAWSGLLVAGVGIGADSQFTPHLLATLGVVTVNGVIAWCLCQARTAWSAKASLACEAVLHATALLLACVVFLVHFELPNAFAASVSLALAALLLARWLPFRCLAELSPLPIVLAVIHHLAKDAWGVSSPYAGGWLVALPALLAYLGFFEYALRRPQRLIPKTSSALARWVAFTVAVAAMLTLRSAIPDPWHAPGYIVCALIGAALWRGAGFHLGFLEASVVPAGAAVISVFVLSTKWADDRVTQTLLACTLVAAGVLIYGLVITARHGARYRHLALWPAIVGTLLAFWIFIADELGVKDLTTVCWGITAILVFIAGLAGGLKSYRLVGLAGIILCLLRVFIVDIDDNLYRIIASFVLGLVSLLTGFLYHRFRHLIEAFDKDDAV